MRRNLRFLIYTTVGLALLGITLAVPAAWATPDQARPAQTVPTRTPVRTFVPTIAPTEAPTLAPATPEPGGQPGQPAATATPEASPVPGATVTQAPVTLRLTKEVDRTVVWPGLEVTFTLTLVNQGTTSARQVAIEDALPETLQPGAIQGTAAVWDGQTLRARTPVLPPGGRFTVTFTALVREDVQPGGAILNLAAATAAGANRAVAAVVLALPPAELPPTGANTER